MSTLLPGVAGIIVDTIVAIHDQVEPAKYLATASCTLLVYDWVTCLDAEAKHVWGRPWKFGRIAYHLNRVWPMALLYTSLPLLLFSPSMSPSACRRTMFFYAYGTVVEASIVCTVVLMRCWAIYNQIWILRGLIIGLGITVIVSMVFVKLLTDRAVFFANPFPDVFSGCLVILPSYTWSIYVVPMIYECVVFGLTVRRIRQMKNEFGTTPLMHRLSENAARYFLVLLGISLFACLGTTNSSIKVAANVSGIFSSLSSTVCNRIIFSLYQLNDEKEVTLVGTESGSGHFEVPLSDFSRGSNSIALKHTSASHR